MIQESRKQVLDRVQEDRERVMIMDQLYIEDVDENGIEGRHRKEHKYHGVYTNLWLEYIKKQRSEVLNRALKD